MTKNPYRIPCVVMLYKKLLRSMIMFLIGCLPLMSCAQSNGNKYPLDPAYTKYDNLYKKLQRIDRSGADLVQLNLIGFSTNENLPIHALKIGAKTARRNVLIIGQHHGDEVLGVEVSLDIAEYFAENYQKNKKVTAILDQFNFWIVPTINPEGYRIVSSGDYPWKRKNNTDTNKNGRFDIRVDGVDLNRNYPFAWEYDLTIQPESPYFKGFHPGSETENYSIMQLADRISFEFALLYHSSATGAYSEKIYLPWFDSSNDEQKQRIDEIRTAAEVYALQVPKDYQKGYYEVHAGLNSRVGNARNYLFHIHSTKAFLIEIGGINPFGISVIHPSAKMMRKNVEKHRNAILTLFYEYISEGE